MYLIFSIFLQLTEKDANIKNGCVLAQDQLKILQHQGWSSEWKLKWVKVEDGRRKEGGLINAVKQQGRFFASRQSPYYILQVISSSPFCNNTPCFLQKNAKAV